MGEFLDSIKKRLASAGSSSGLTMTGEDPTEVVVNPDLVVRSESTETVCPRCGRPRCQVHGRK